MESHGTVGFWCRGIAQKFLQTSDTSFDTKIIVKCGAIEFVFKSHETLQRYQLASIANSAKKAG